MKQFLLLTSLIVALSAFGQIDVFNYTGALNTNGWTTHSGTAGQLVTLTTPSDVGNSLSYAGLPASTGNRTATVAANSEDVNKALSGITGTGYYSFLLKVDNTTGLTAVGGSGDHFIGFATTSGATASVFGGRVYIKAGATAGTFLLGTLNFNGGTPVPAYSPVEYPINTTLFIAVKLDATVTPCVASLFVNPVPGAAEPAATVTHNLGINPYTNFASLYLRQGTNTGNFQIDEIRAGGTWASVTPNGCASSNTMTITNCGPYTLNSQTYTTSGAYTQVLPNANAVGCDSTIILNLTVNNPTSSTITTSSCGDYTLNAQTYSTSGTYIQVLTNGNAAGCDSTITLNLTVVSSFTYYADTDNDGFGDPAVDSVSCAQPVGFVLNANDCDDNNASVGMGMTYYADADADGFGDPAVDSIACSQPVGYVTNADDCDDNNGSIGVALSYYPDVDNDGFGDATATAIVTCTPPVNYVTNNTDCNDANGNAYPGATEIPNNGIDEDCNGSDLNTLGTQLAQYTFTGNSCATPVLGVDVQPANATFSDYFSDSVTCATGANVINSLGWNNGSTIDTNEYYGFSITPDNCYELSLSELIFTHRGSNSLGNANVHVRTSLDNFTTDIYTVQLAVPGTAQTENVTLPPAFVSITGPITFRFYLTDASGTTTTYRHDNVSVVGSINALPQQTFYADADGDGFGDPLVDSMDCIAPAGYVLDNTDCNDANADENPNAIWYQDLDNDSYGNSGVTLTQCTQPVGYVANGYDCDDSDANTGLPLTYYEDADNDGFGNEASVVEDCTQPVGYVLVAGDCDDNNDAITVATTEFYADADNDGFGDAATNIIACTPPNGYVANSNDCDDNNATITLGNTYYEDGDNDGFGNANSTVVACTVPNGYVTDSTDCDDTNNAINPNATDILGNSIDENCDGVDGNLGLNDAVLANFSVYPNPGTAFVHVVLNGSWNSEVTITVLSVDGKEIQQTVAAASETVSVSTNQLIPSVYFIRVSDGSHVSVARWVKQ